MGRPKLLLPWGNTTVAGHLLRLWSRLGPMDVLAVLAPADDRLAEELSTRRPANLALTIVRNPEPDRGMFSSVQVAAARTRGLSHVTHWFVSLGDQPLIRGETLARLREASQDRPEAIWQPARDGRPRHPILLPAGELGAVAEARGPTLKEWLAGREAVRALMPSDDDGLDVDLDTPGDYAAAIRRAFSP